MKSRLSVIACLVPFLTCAGEAPSAAQPQTATPRWNAPAPALALELLRVPESTDTSWQTLKGQATVLEFWATWCSGCVAQIPHLNALTETFKGRPIRFISVTDEDKEVVAAFLKKRPISGWVGLDPGSVTFRRYGIEGRPYTALVDAEGNLRGLIPPTALQESVIEQLMAGTLRMQEPNTHTPIVGTEPDAPMALLQAIVRPAMPVNAVGMSPGATRTTGNRWEAWGLDVRSLIALACSVKSTRVILPDGTPRTRYDLYLVLPDEDLQHRRIMLQHLLESAFHLTVRNEVRNVDVLVLRKAGAVGIAPLAKGRTVARVAEFAEGYLGRIVVDETGLSGTYDLVVSYPKSEQDLYVQLKAAGLSLRPEQRPLDVAVATEVQER